MKAHIGHAQNEEADALAKAGTEEPVPADLDLPLSKAFFRAQIKEGVQQEWDTRWNSRDKMRFYRQTRQFLSRQNARFTKDVSKLNREALSHVIQTITGHGYLHYHQQKLGRVESPNCRWCEEEDETGWHLIHDCPAWSERREDLLEKTKCATSLDMRFVLEFIKVHLGPFLNPDAVGQVV